VTSRWTGVDIVPESFWLLQACTFCMQTLCGLFTYTPWPKNQHWRFDINSFVGPVS
jgi:hypothetical protein